MKVRYRQGILNAPVSYLSHSSGVYLDTSASYIIATASDGLDEILITIPSSTAFLAWDGYDGTLGTANGNVDGITFATEAALNPSATISPSRMGLVGTNSITSGYAMGGVNVAGSVRGRCDTRK